MLDLVKGEVLIGMKKPIERVGTLKAVQPQLDGLGNTELSVERWRSVHVGQLVVRKACGGVLKPGWQPCWKRGQRAAAGMHRT